MHLLVCGLDQHSAPVAVRERCSWPAEALPAALTALSACGLAEVAVLCTCNRTEVYAVADNPATALAGIGEVFAERAGISVQVVRAHLYTAVGAAESLRHLCRVACGLEAVVLGETQVLGQVRQAYLDATAGGGVGKMLHALFHHALACAKRVHTNTGIASAPVSVGAAAVDHARRTLGDLRARHVAVLGAGATAGTVAHRLHEAGCGRIVVLNRTQSHGERLAGAVGGQAVPLTELIEELVAADVVVSSTAARQPVVTGAAVRQAVARRSGRPLLLIDIAVPRDVDPGVEEIPGVRLCNIDDLDGASAGLADRAREAAAAMAIIEEEVAQFADWLRSLDVVPLIRALDARFQAVAAEQASRTLRRLPRLEDDERDRVRQLAMAVAAQLLDPALRRLKELAGTPGGHDAVRALAHVFDCDPTPVVGLPGGAGDAAAVGH